MWFVFASSDWIAPLPGNLGTIGKHLHMILVTHKTDGLAQSVGRGALKYSSPVIWLNGQSAGFTT